MTNSLETDLNSLQQTATEVIAQFTHLVIADLVGWVEKRNPTNDQLLVNYGIRFSRYNESIMSKHDKLLTKILLGQ